MSFIIYNGKSSEDFYLLLSNEMNFSSPELKTEFVELPGVDGEVDISDGTMKNGKRSFPFTILPDKKHLVEELATDISNWLKADNLWHKLEFNGEPDYIYLAKFHEEYNTERILSYYGKVVLTFTIKPYKFLRSGLAPLENPTSLFNQTVRDARPKITIRGTGNITLKIGSEELKLKNVEDGVIIDSLYQTATDLAGNNSVWDKVLTYPLPVIKPGNQAITITGGTFSIVPRFEVIV